MPINFLDLFAGAGGLSEGFVQAGFEAIAHIEMNEAACYTLRTRQAYFYLKENGQLDLYDDYLLGNINREEFYKKIPQPVFDNVINKEITKNTRSYLFKKVKKLLGKRKLDLIIGGPPCQAYSLVGRSRQENNMLGDKRNYLYVEYAQFLEEFKPQLFLFENVIGLLSAKDLDGSKHIDNMISTFKKAGYSVNHITVDASEHNVPQSRKRVFIIGIRSQNEYNLILPISDQRLTVDQFIEDLTILKSGEGSLLGYKSRVKNKLLELLGIKDNHPLTMHQARPHNDRDLEIYRKSVNLWNLKKERINYNNLPKELQTHKNRESFLDRYKVVVRDQPSHTVVAHIAKDGHYYIHPDINQNRSLTVREVARLQTFPDNYFFESISGKPARTAAYLQIGNAVPVLLAKEIANKIKQDWRELCQTDLGFPLK